LSCPTACALRPTKADEFSRNAEELPGPSACLGRTVGVCLTQATVSLNPFFKNGASVTNSSFCSALKILPLFSGGARGNFFRSDKTRDESQHVRETRGLTWGQGGQTGQTLPRPPAVKARNKEVTCPNKGDK